MVGPERPHASAQNKTPAGRHDRAGVFVVAEGEQIRSRFASRGTTQSWIQYALTLKYGAGFDGRCNHAQFETNL
jgi:hypothetical protein